jgi:prepilin-type N-terminal cleavage/methylation domain-containing protein
MFRRYDVVPRGARPGMTLIELAMAIAALGLLGCLFLASRMPSAGTECNDPPAIAISTPPAPPHIWYGEKSLQETLDRLGYTVNIPHVYHTRRVATDGYRFSTRDDSIAASWFCTRGAASFQIISQQSALRGETTLCVSGRGGRLQTLLGPEVRGVTNWEGAGPVRFALSFAANSFGSRLFHSTPAENPDGGAQLIVLPARTGGRWVESDEGTQYWEGGADTGEYLLCWEDVVHGDADYQDLVILARGLVPVTTDVQQAQ